MILYQTRKSSDKIPALISPLCS